MPKYNQCGERVIDAHCESLNLERINSKTKELRSQLRRQREAEARIRVRQEMIALMGPL